MHCSTGDGQLYRNCNVAAHVTPQVAKESQSPVGGHKRSLHQFVSQTPPRRIPQFPRKPSSGGHPSAKPRILFNPPPSSPPLHSLALVLTVALALCTRSPYTHYIHLLSLLQCHRLPCSSPLTRSRCTPLQTTRAFSRSPPHHRNTRSQSHRLPSRPHPPHRRPHPPLGLCTRHSPRLPRPRQPRSRRAAQRALRSSYLSDQNAPRRSSTRSCSRRRLPTRCRTSSPGVSTRRPSLLSTPARARGDEQRGQQAAPGDAAAARNTPRVCNTH